MSEHTGTAQDKGPARKLSTPKLLVAKEEIVEGEDEQDDYMDRWLRHRLNTLSSPKLADFYDE